MMNVAVDDGHLAQTAVALQAPDGHGDIVEQAETFTMIGEGVVKATAKVHRGAALERELCCDAGATGHQPETLDEPGQPRKLQSLDVFLGQQSVADLVQVLGGVNEREVIPRYGMRLGESGPMDIAAGHQLCGYQSVFRGWPHVAGEIQLVVPRKNNRVQGQPFSIAGTPVCVWAADGTNAIARTSSMCDT